MFVRISRGRFDPSNLTKVTAMLNESEASLVPALQELPGLKSYRTGIDSKDGTMIAVSLWDSAEHAAALGSLPEMNAQRPLFQENWVVFDPISTYEILWEV